MPTLKTNLTEMKHAQVSRISLVSKAASRIPFRVIKEDRTMNPLTTLDLARVFKRDGQQKTAELVGVITMKGDGMKAVSELVTKSGLKADSVVENSDGSVVLKQGDMDGAVAVVKLSDEVAVALKGFSPYNMALVGTDENSASFADMCAAQGFYPSVSTMMGVLQSSVYDMACKSDDPAGAAEAVSKMFDEAKAYAVSMLKGLPTSAFKMEVAMKSANWPQGKKGAPNVNDGGPPVPGVPDGAQGVVGTGGNESEAADAAGKKAAAMTTDQVNPATGVGGGSPVVAAKADGNVADNLTGPDGLQGKTKTPKPTPDDEASGGANAKVSGGVSKADMETMLNAGLLALGQKLQDQFGSALAPVSKSLNEMNDRIGGLAAKVNEVEGVAKAAERAVKGTVMGSEAGDHASQTQKSGQRGEGYRSREIDTGWAPRSNRAAR